MRTENLTILPHSAADSEHARPREATRIPEAEHMLSEGVKAAQAGERQCAKALLLRAVELDPKCEKAWLWLSSISEYPEELLTFLTKVLDINPANERAIEWASATKALLAKNLIQRGMDAADSGQRTEARELFEQAAEHDPANTSALINLAGLTDSTEEKASYYARVLQIEPENEDARKGLDLIRATECERMLSSARRAAVSGDNAEAETILNSLLSKEPELEEAWVMLSHIAKDIRAKTAAYRRILEINPHNQIAATGLDSISKLLEASDESDQTADPAEALEDLTIEEAAVDQGGIVSTEETWSPSESRDPEVSVWPEIQYIPQEREESSFYENSSPVVDMEEVTFDQVVPELEREDKNLPMARIECEDDSETEHRNDNVVPFGTAREQLEYSGYAEYASAAAEQEIGAIQRPDFAGDAFDAPFDAVDPGGIPMPARDPLPAQSTGFETTVAGRQGTRTQGRCPFCEHENEPQAISCGGCLSVLTLADIELILANQDADKRVVLSAVEAMERELATRDLSEAEFTTLGIGHLNLRNLQYGYNYLRIASQKNPDNVVLAGQVNALLIRIDEIRRQDENHEGMTRGKTLLVVDDSPTVRKLIAGKLEKCGHTVHCANDGVEAMEKLAVIRPDLILLDINMPRMDGYQVCKLIRGNDETKDVPVVMISGKDGFFDKVRGKMAGTSGYITKPFGPEALMKAVEAYLKGEAEQ
jgi:CheY-like chemotaxis protein/Tfp pilus assembly protein PilF